MLFDIKIFKKLKESQVRRISKIEKLIVEIIR